MSQDTPEPSEQHYFPYQFNVPPSLGVDGTGSVAIVVTNDVGDGQDSVSGERPEIILLPGSMMDRIHRALERGLNATSMCDSLRVIAFCCPRNDDSLAVDAAVLYSAHWLRMDVLKFDAEQLATDETRIFPPGLDSALYDLYSIEEFDSNDPAHNDALSRAVTYLRDFINTFSPEARHSRPRVLYLRNFAAMSYVLVPFIQALRSAIGGCEMPVLVVVGIWPVTQLRDPTVDPEPIDHDADSDTDLPAAIIQRIITSKFPFVRGNADDRSSDAFVSAFRTPSSLRTYVESHFTPRDFSLCTPNDGLTTLSDVFQAGMMQHYGVKRFSESHRANPAPNPPTMIFEYAEVLPITAHHVRPIPGHVIAKVASQVARWNIKRLAASLGNLGIHARPCFVWASEWETPTGGSTTLSKLAREMSQAELDTLAADVQDSLPSATPTYAEIVRGIQHLDTMLDALQSHISVIKGNDARTGQLVETAISKLVREGRLKKGDIALLKTLVVDPATFSTRYADVIVSPTVMEAVQSGIASTSAPSSSGGILDSESPGGFLLFGPPGTGKTMLCRAIAKECGVRFMHVRPSDIHSHYSGISEKTMRCIFELARSLDGCIVFFDELDALFARRGDGGNSERFFRSILAEFLQEMDGLATASANKSAKVVVIGATNRPQDVDDAVIRRFSQRILVDLPNKPLREQIIRGYLKGLQTEAAFSIPSLVKRTEHYSGSDIKHLVRLAVELATREAKDTRSTLPTPSAPALPSPSNLPPALGPSSLESAHTAVSAPMTPPAGTGPDSTASVENPTVLYARHFDAALERVKASCLTNMHALRSVQQFERRKAAQLVSISVTIPLGFFRRLFS